MRVTNTVTAIVFGSTLIATAAFAAQVEVSQKDKMFAPDATTAALGSTVHIINDDTVSHNVLITSPDGTSKNSGVQQVGDGVDIPINQAGDYKVRCGIHPKMRLVIHAQ